MQSDHPFDRVLERLAARGCRFSKRKHAMQQRVSCPAHRDLKPSLVVTRVDDKVLMKCFGGCKVREIVAAIGLEMRDLFCAGPVIRRAPTEIAAYPYTDASGRVLAEKVRYFPKGFAWRTLAPSSASRWVYSLNGVDLGLYARHALRPELLFVAEGEKAVDRLRDLGLNATCGPAGASRWETNWTGELVAAGVPEAAVLVDNDGPGRRHAKTVVTSCLEFDLPARLIELPGIPWGGDVCDWLLLGGDRASLLRIVEAAPRWSPHLEIEARLARKREMNRVRQAKCRARRRCDLRAETATDRVHGVTPSRVTLGERTSRIVTKELISVPSDRLAREAK